MRAPRLLVAGVLLAACASANAVPAVVAAITAIGASIGGVVGAAMIMYASALAYIVIGVGLYSFSRYQKRKAEAKARAAYNASLQDRVVTVRSSIEPRRLVLGRQRVGGVTAFMGSTGVHKEKLAWVVAFAGHEIDAFESFWLDDKPVTLDGSGNVTTTEWCKVTRESKFKDVAAGSTSYVVDYPPIAGTAFAVLSTEDGTVVNASGVSGSTVSFAVALGADARIHYQTEVTTPRVRVLPHLGADDQAADSVMLTLFPDDWTVDHRGRGVAYAVFLFDYDTDVFPRGLPNPSAVMRGLKCEDPRTGLTAWTEDPALLIAAFTTHPLGGRLPGGSVNEVDTIASANVNDDPVDYATWGLLTVGGAELTVGGASLKV